jgi:hypothetical protein
LICPNGSTGALLAPACRASQRTRGRERRLHGASADKEIVTEPVYEVKVLDRVVTRVAREIRLLEHAVRRDRPATEG